MTRNNWWLPGLSASLLIAALTLLPFAAMIASAGQLDWSSLAGDTYLRRVVRFSFLQASLSTLLSLTLAIPLALALAHLPRFPGRGLLLHAMSLTLVLPTIIAIYGLVAVFGQKGWLASWLAPLNVELPSIYGLGGILLAHVFLNMPLAARVMLQSIEAIPSNQWRLASQLGMPERTVLRHLEWPAIAGMLIPFALLIFTLCFTSFAIVMTLGGGPRATTIEVAIYQAVRFDFDLARAVALALLQLGFCLVLMLLGTAVRSRDVTSGAVGDAGSLGLSSTLSGDTHHWRQLHPALRRSRTGRSLKALCVMLASLFILLPLVALVVSAINPRTLAVITDDSTLRAAGNTLIAALAASTIAVGLALALLTSSRYLSVRRRQVRAGHRLQLVGNVILVLPPLVLGTGLFLLLRPLADVFSLALILVILVNALMALPFVLRILEAPFINAAKHQDRLIQSLGIQGWSRWRWLDWPVIRRPLGHACGVAATLAAGDLSAIALFGSTQWQTLPLLLYQRMGSYRLDEAAVTGGMLLLLCILLYLGLQRIVGGRAMPAVAK
ncbi:MAG: thiamine/thiamine pyrophosphate ABC transporter, permease protein [Gammaproteobacteria bacterium]|nr:MAG: thiamine/thiamine pyrophosphate ABC transporter, permease protein [Gammaproteobacteria bacterium]PIE36889.1 MAG: thiamine/thiamine pyrophosphate ABC transporter, permease protein [Gammaproteobacteria bacterium]